MTRAGWLDPSTRDRFARAVADIEARTSAEIVVAVSSESQHYRDVGHLLGALAALVFLVVYVYSPFPFYDDLLLLEILGLFTIVSLLAPRSAWLVRYATTRRRRRAAAESCAKVSFVDCGIADTRNRTGILVHISIFERELVVLPDVGIATAELPDWPARIAALERALVEPAPIERVLERLAALGAPLANVHPAAPDDINELADGLVST